MCGLVSLAYLLCTIGTRIIMCRVNLSLSLFLFLGVAFRFSVCAFALYECVLESFCVFGVLAR